MHTLIGVFDAYPRTLERVCAEVHTSGAVLPVAAFQQLSSRVLTGLLFLEDNSVLHWDLKADNVMMSADGVPSIGDLGEALRVVCVPVDQKSACTVTWAYFVCMQVPSVVIVRNLSV